MNTIDITVNNIRKRFDRRVILSDISMKIATGDSIAITGSNGAGKSTLLEIIAGIKRPSSGNVDCTYNGLPVTGWFEHIGFVSPRCNVYESLTGAENIGFAVRHADAVMIDQLLDAFDLRRHRNLPVRTYSTGMKQRLKIICAMINRPAALLLDEPSSNMDSAGRDALFALLEHRRRDCALVIATNSEHEAALCERRISLG